MIVLKCMLDTFFRKYIINVDRSDKSVPIISQQFFHIFSCTIKDFTCMFNFYRNCTNIHLVIFNWFQHRINPTQYPSYNSPLCFDLKSSCKHLTQIISILEMQLLYFLRVQDVLKSNFTASCLFTYTFHHGRHVFTHVTL